MPKSWMVMITMLFCAWNTRSLAEDAPKAEGTEVTVAGTLKPAPKDAKEGVLAVLELPAGADKGTPQRTLNVRAKSAPVTELVAKILKEVEGQRALVTITGDEKDGGLTVTKQIKVLTVGAKEEKKMEEKER